MTEERLKEIIQKIFDWGDEISHQVPKDIQNAAELTKDEIYDLDIVDYFPEFYLPKEVEIPASSLDEDLELEDAISDYLSDRHDYCVNTFEYEYIPSEGVYIVSNIDWDTTE